jgi:D-amino peptidase
MKIYILADMEGISGVCRAEQVRAGDPAWAEARAYLEADVNACARGLFAAGARTVVVRDVHETTFNLRWHELDPRLELVQGDGRQAGRMPGLRGFDGVVLLGYHAMAGTRAAVLEHTSSSRAWQRFWINGRESGEIAIDAAVAGDEGVPVLLVTGDDKACAEARRFLPGVTTAAVKTGLDCQYARFLSRPVSLALIERQARVAISRIKAVRPFRVRRPVRLRLEFVERQPLPGAVGRPWLRILDGRTIEIKGRTFTEARERLL